MHHEPLQRAVRIIISDYSSLKRQKLHILTPLTRDIQCEKFIEDEAVSHEPCDSMYPNRDKEREDVVKTGIEKHTQIPKCWETNNLDSKLSSINNCIA